jgi:NRPS condensation-like uncharacterized protein
MKRETITYERILYYMGNDTLMHFAFRVKVKPCIKKSEIRHALLKTQKKHPLAGVRVIMTKDKDQFIRQYITTEDAPEIPLKELEGDKTDWKAVIAEELCRSFDIFKGPMIRVFLIQGKAGSDIVVIFHHAICDGLSAVVFLHDMLLFLADKDKPVNPYPEAPVFTKLIKKDILEIIKKKEIPEWIKNRDSTEQKPVKKEPFQKPDYVIHNWSFDEGKTKKVISLAKENSVSLHGILGAILLKSFAQEFGPKEGFKRVLQSPISFKPFMVDEAKNYFGLFNGILTAEIDCSPERTIPEIASDINKKLKGQLDKYDPLIGYYFFNTYMLEGVKDPELMFSKRHGMPMNYDFSFSNLGVIQMQKKYGKYEAEEVYGPIFSAIRNERVIGLTTHQGKMFFNCIYDKNGFDHIVGSRIIKRILDSFQDIFK